MGRTPTHVVAYGRFRVEAGYLERGGVPFPDPVTLIIDPDTDEERRIDMRVFDFTMLVRMMQSIVPEPR